MKFLPFVVFLFATSVSFSGLAQPSNAPAPVFVSAVKRVQFVDEVEALGTLQANENVNLTSAVTERVSKILFSDNERVKRGKILIEMDAAQEEAELIEEQSRHDEAQKQVDRLRPLVKKKASPQAILDQRERELKSAAARIKAIYARINERRIVAPFDGVVGIRNISVGTLARPGTLLTTIDDDSVMKLDFSIPEVFLSSLRPGIEIQAKTRAYPAQVFSGKVSSIDSRVDVNSRAVAARAILDNQKGLLKAGMLMRIVLHNSPRTTLVVPEEALIKRGEKNYVMTLVDAESSETSVERRQVNIGARRVGEVEILGGLASGERVVIHGLNKIRDGARVTVRAQSLGSESLPELLQQRDAGDS